MATSVGQPFPPLRRRVIREGAALLAKQVLSFTHFPAVTSLVEGMQAIVGSLRASQNNDARVQAQLACISRYAGLLKSTVKEIGDNHNDSTIALLYQMQGFYEATSPMPVERFTVYRAIAK